MKHVQIKKETLYWRLCLSVNIILKLKL